VYSRSFPLEIKRKKPEPSKESVGFKPSLQAGTEDQGSANHTVIGYVSDVGRRASFRQKILIYIGAAIFLVALLVSAILLPEFRVLHCFQALIYVAVIVLA